MKPKVSIKGLSFSFGKKRVIEGLDLDLYSGEILGLIGRSGCGKSTLMKILVGYYTSQSGSIIFNEADIIKDFNKIRRLVGYTTQENSFYDKLTLYENLAYYANLYDVKSKNLKEHIESTLKKVHLLESKNLLAERISGGMKRRLDFAISLVHDPELIILDEPTTGLDPLLIDDFWKLVCTVSKENKKTVLVTSHIMPEIEQYCDRVAIMDHGAIVKIVDLKKQGNKRLEEEFRSVVGAKK